MRALGLAALAAALALGAALGGCGGAGAVAPTPTVPELRIGMSIQEGKRELGPRFRLPYWGANVTPGCGYFEIEGPPLGGLVLDKHIATVRFSVETDPDSGRVLGPGPEALRGLRPGQTLDHAIELFGRPDRISPAESSGGEDIFWKLAEEDGTDVYLRVPTSSYFKVGKGRIGSFEIGAEPGIFYPEGCA